MSEIKKKDKVEVITGRDKGKRGEVTKVIDDRVLVTGINMVTKHQKPNRAGQPGGITQMEAPIHRSNVQVVCPSCDKKTRPSTETLKDGEKVRKCKKCGKEIV